MEKRLKCGKTKIESGSQKYAKWFATDFKVVEFCFKWSALSLEVAKICRKFVKKW